MFLNGIEPRTHCLIKICRKTEINQVVALV